MEVRTSYTRDSNETSDEKGPQRIPYIDYCGHGDSRVWGKDNGSKEDGEELLRVDIIMANKWGDSVL